MERGGAGPGPGAGDDVRQVAAAAMKTTPARDAVAPSRPSVDQAESKFRLVTLTAQRAKQLQNGARPRVDGGDHKFLRVALLEVMAGTVSWSLAEAKG